MHNFTKTITAGAKAALVGFSLFALSACDGTAEFLPPKSATDVGATKNIVETAVEAGSFETLVMALQATGLDAALADESKTYTVFAPTDEAFTALGSETMDALMADPDRLRNILLYHVIPENAVDAQTAISLAGGSVDAANGEALVVSLQGADLFINSSKVIATDIFATNGIIHVIDTVLLPVQDNSGNSNTNTNTDNSGTDTGINTVVSTGDGTANTGTGGNSGSMDNTGTGGNSGSTDNTNNSQGETNQGGNGLPNIVDTAVAAGSFNTLAAALATTGLDSVLADESAKYTVFAPTDAAFNALGQNTIDALLADPDTLKNILLYHVIGGTAVEATTAVSLAGTKVTAANGNEFALSVNDGSLYVNLSKVTATDILASNGVIHVIDTVLSPPMVTMGSGSVVDVAAADGRFTTLVTALKATHLDAVLADHSGVFTVFAPTDDAFNLLGADTINSLLGDIPTLSNILLTHVISGATIDSVSAFAATGGSVETASGADVALSIRDGALFVNNAKVIITDIKAENGIIHVIDSVIQ